MELQIFHDELETKCPAYKALSDAKLRGWKSKTYVRPRVVLASADEYAENYTKYLLPNLHFDDANQLRYKFFDMGSAPGGLCQALLRWHDEKQARNKWFGVAVTLNPADGGIPMKFKNDSLEVRYADVHTGEKFLEDVVLPDDVGAYSFVNCGIVVDQNLKRYLSTGVSYCEQLITQLQATKLLLKPKGSFMMVLNLDFPSLPEVLCIIFILIRHAQDIHIVPTVYTRTAARKQFYLLVNGVTLTTEIVDELSSVWRKAHKRHVSRKRKFSKEKNHIDTQETTETPEGCDYSKDFVRSVVDVIINSSVMKELSSFFEVLTEALEEGHFT